MGLGVNRQDEQQAACQSLIVRKAAILCVRTGPQENDKVVKACSTIRR
jgi:hypothetical protein